MSDWWQRKLGGEPAPREPRGAPVPQAVPPQQRPMQQVPQQYAPQGQVQYHQQPPQQQYGDEILPEGASANDLVAHNAQRLATKTYNEIPAQAQALKTSGGQCPSCQSTNYYMGTQSGGGAHCHDCGYPIVQAGSGMGALGGTGIVATGGQHAARSPQYSQQLGG